MKSYTCNPIVRSRYQPFRNTFSAPVFNRDFLFDTVNENKSTRPAANIIRKEGGYEIKLAIPGLSKDQIKLEVVENKLTVSAINNEKDEKQNGFVRQEYDYTGFKRAFMLHKNADTAALTASFDQGILTITIPDKEPETININIQ